MPAPRSLILITVDCLRADHVGCFGYSKPTTPFLDCLAAESFSFTNAVVAGAPTYYSLPAILGSRYPLALGRDLLGFSPDESTIASVLQESSFATAAFSAANPYISSRFGYDRGFDLFRDFLDTDLSQSDAPRSSKPGLRTRANQALARACHMFPPLGTAYDELYFHYCNPSGRSEPLDSLRQFPSADVIVDQALPWIRENSRKPFFLWLHFMDPHAPYYPSPEALTSMGLPESVASDAKYLNAYWKRQDLSMERLAAKREQVVRLYDAGIRWADAQIRRLSEQLVELNLWDKCALAVTADHGEEFLDHGDRFHAPIKLTQELIHVPLLLRVPGLDGGRIDSLTSLIHLAPTLLDLMDVSSPADFRGRSCWNYMRDGAQWNWPAISECVHGCTNPFRSDNRMGSRILSVRRAEYKLLIDFTTGADQLFNLSQDPGEHDPLSGPADVRHDLLECARRHLAESHKSRDFDRRNASQLRDLRIEWAHSGSHISN